MKELPGISRLLVVQTSRLGDCILATPALQLLRESYPEARLDVLWEPRSVHARVLGRARLYREIRANNYDTAIFLYGSPSPVWAAFAARIPRRISRHTLNMGPHYAGRYLCNIVVHQDRNLCERHEAEYDMDLLAPLGIRPRHVRPYYPVADDDRVSVRDVLTSHGVASGERLVILHAGSSPRRSRWPASRFAVVGDALSAQGARVVLTGSAEDGDRPERVAEAMRAPSVNLSRQLTLSQLAALMERASLFVGLDTGPMHIAAAFGVPVVVLLPQQIQPRLHGRWYPYGSDYIPVRGLAVCDGCDAAQCVRHPEDGEPACTASLRVEPVIDAATALLAGTDHPDLVRWQQEVIPSPAPAYREAVVRPGR